MLPDCQRRIRSLFGNVTLAQVLHLGRQNFKQIVSGFATVQTIFSLRAHSVACLEGFNSRGFILLNFDEGISWRGLVDK